MEHQFIVKSDAIKGIVNKVVNSLPLDPPQEVVIRAYKSKRSSAQNRLMWMWLSEIAEQYQVDGKRLSKEEWHHLCSMKFLGIKTIEIGSKTFPMPAKSTTKLTVNEFTEYLLNIESEFLPKGVVLTFPDYYGLAMEAA